MNYVDPKPYDVKMEVVVCLQVASQLHCPAGRQTHGCIMQRLTPISRHTTITSVLTDILQVNLGSLHLFCKGTFGINGTGFYGSSALPITNQHCQ